MGGFWVIGDGSDQYEVENEEYEEAMLYRSATQDLQQGWGEVKRNRRLDRREKGEKKEEGWVETGLGETTRLRW
jgi:hypothetical protein